MTQIELKYGAIVLTAPSGSGKSTIARHLEEAISGLRFSVSATTRPPREGEADGVHYHFLSEENFRKAIDAGEFLEYEEVYPGRFYGTLFEEIKRIDEEGPVLLDIDVNGAMRMKSFAGNSALVLFIHPMSIEELSKRLQNRGTESPDWLAERIKRAEMELTFAEKCDHVIYNDVLEDAVTETLQVVNQFLKAKQEQMART
ncbi:MAG: guanylate kinase [Bacteroidota bacterium]